MPHKDSEKRKEYKKKWALKNKERLKELRKNRTEEQKEHRKEYIRKYNREWREKNPERSREIVSKSFNINKEKYYKKCEDEKHLNYLKRKAREILGNSVKNGESIKPTKCSNCGVEARKIEGHHEDYNKPLEVIWLCCRCHRRLHAELKKQTNDKK